MPKLVLNAGTPQAQEFNLKPGKNYIGRGFANDFKLDDASVSGSHALVTMNGAIVTVTDLGSTNGTRINMLPATGNPLQSGQIVRLGAVELLFVADATGGPAPPAVLPPTSAEAVKIATEFIMRDPGHVAVSAPPPPLAAPVPPPTSIAPAPVPVQAASLKIPPPPAPAPILVAAAASAPARPAGEIRIPTAAPAAPPPPTPTAVVPVPPPPPPPAPMLTASPAPAPAAPASVPVQSAQIRIPTPAPAPAAPAPIVPIAAPVPVAESAMKMPTAAPAPVLAAAPAPVLNIPPPPAPALAPMPVIAATAPSGPKLSLSGSSRTYTAAPVAAVAAPATGMEEVAEPAVALEPIEAPPGMVACKFHRNTSGQWLCQKCTQLFCSLCVITRPTPAGTGHFCRTCGTQCAPVRIKAIARKEKKMVEYSESTILLRTVGFAVGGTILGAALWTGASAVIGIDFPFIYAALMGAICGFAVKIASQDRPGGFFSVIAIVATLIAVVLGKLGAVLVTHNGLVTGTVLLTGAVGLAAGLFLAWKIGGGDF